MAVHQVNLQKVLDPAQPFQDQLVASVKLDPGLSIDALGTQLGTELAFRFGTVASRFP